MERRHGTERPSRYTPAVPDDRPPVLDYHTPQPREPLTERFGCTAALISGLIGVVILLFNVTSYREMADLVCFLPVMAAMWCIGGFAIGWLVGSVAQHLRR
jgi:hypothetical protein